MPEQVVSTSTVKSTEGAWLGNWHCQSIWNPISSTPGSEWNTIVLEPVVEDTVVGTLLLQ